MADWRSHALEPSYRALADKKVKFLSKSDIQRPDSASDRSHEGTLDADMVLLECLQGLIGKIGSALFESLSSGEDFLPFYPAIFTV